jgi:fluoroacetyl-CoA thioesterase
MTHHALAIGVVGTAALVVAPEHTATAFGSGSVPVFSTPRLVALLERAAVAAVSGRLAPGETSVGTAIAIVHLAATPVGGTVRAEARLDGIDGRRLRFAVVAFDEHEKIGEGTHERVVVDEERFLERVARKALRAPDSGPQLKPEA